MQCDGNRIINCRFESGHEGPCSWESAELELTQVREELRQAKIELGKDKK